MRNGKYCLLLLLNIIIGEISLSQDLSNLIFTCTSLSANLDTSYKPQEIVFEFYRSKFYLTHARYIKSKDSILFSGTTFYYTKDTSTSNEHIISYNFYRYYTGDVRPGIYKTFGTLEYNPKYKTLTLFYYKRGDQSKKEIGRIYRYKIERSEIIRSKNE